MTAARNNEYRSGHTCSASINNTAGKLQASLAVTETGGVLYIYNSAGEPQVGLGGEKASGAIYVLNKNGERVAGFSTDDDGNGVIDVSNRNGKGQTLQRGN
jgi:hypothetical protein